MLVTVYKKREKIPQRSWTKFICALINVFQVKLIDRMKPKPCVKTQKIIIFTRADFWARWYIHSKITTQWSRRTKGKIFRTGDLTHFARTAQQNSACPVYFPFVVLFRCFVISLKGTLLFQERQRDRKATAVWNCMKLYIWQHNWRFCLRWKHFYTKTQKETMYRDYVWAKLYSSYTNQLNRYCLFVLSSLPEELI